MTVVDAAGIAGALDRARTFSPFLRLQLEALPAVADAIASGDLERALAVAQTEAADEDLMAALRRERSGYALVLGIGDLAGLLDLEALTAELSALAERALARALAAAIAERTGEDSPIGFAIVALGKLGGSELNYSSDVDLLFLYDPETLPRRAREAPDQAGLRVAQRVVELLQKRTGDGYAFRVDLRLRPSPEVTPIALPVDAAISYYESSALPWERAAFIKARFVAGDADLGSYFLDAIHPFVWRRSLDFGAIGELQSLTRRIRDHYADVQGFGPGYDVKRGRGGIREVEFFVQVHQLIHGGREPELRAPATLPALASLADSGRIAEADARTLRDGYRLLRTVEHRLQMVDDLQTHSLPRDQEALDNVARLHGVAGGDALLALIEPQVRQVEALYGRLGEGEGRRLPHDPAALKERLVSAGFVDAAAARSRIDGWRSGRIRSLRTAAAREAFEAMLPAMVDGFGLAPDPSRAMNRFEDVIQRLPSGVNFFRLLEARPALAEHLAIILSHAPVLAEQLGRRPELLDGLIDATAFAPVPGVDDLIASLGRSDRADDDYQTLLDRVRRRVNERRFALGAQLVVGRTDPIEAAEGYSRIAEAAIDVLASATAAEFELAHGQVDGSEIIILGLGRLGGEALTYASDLDLIYVFSGTHEAESKGPRPLRATDYFNRLAPRISAALSVPTAAGPLYDVDTRLRPNGPDGLLAVSLASFARYQREEAWTWEHMALLRARPIYGSPGAKAALQRAIDSILSAPRDLARTTADAARMRRDIAAHKPPSGPLDIKHGEGGLIDLEFAVQTLQLRHRIGMHPRLERALEVLAAAGLVSVEVDPALRLLTRMLVMFRLVSPAGADPHEATRPLIARACGLESWDELLAAHALARQTIADLWRAVRDGEE